VSSSPGLGIGAASDLPCGFPAGRIGATHDAALTARGEARAMSDTSNGSSVTCTLKPAVGEHETCPGEPCPFWRGGGCVIAGLHADLSTTPGLSELLLRIRDDLGEREPRTYGLVPPGLR
jgi:hypothetical protein